MKSAALCSEDEGMKPIDKLRQAIMQLKLQHDKELDLIVLIDTVYLELNGLYIKSYDFERQIKLLVNKVESTFNSMDKLAHDEAVTDKQFVYHAGFLMSQLVDHAQESVRQVGELNKEQANG
jgi:hypothetical protein